jgi:prephenate dehydrogenase
VHRVRHFLEAKLKLRVFISTPEQHDREMAVVQGLTHLVVRVFTNIGQIEPEYSTVSFEHLMKAVELVRNDSEELFLAIERDNPYARTMRDRYFQSVDTLKLKLEHGHKIGPVEVRRLQRVG